MDCHRRFDPRQDTKNLSTNQRDTTLAWNPTAGDWKLFVPCPEEQFDWAKKTLAARAPRFVVPKPGEKVKEEEKTAAAEAAVEVNWEVFGR